MLDLKHLCSHRTHCVTCRDLEDGREWRKSLGTAYNLPDNKIDFECPHGIKWDVEWVEPIGVKMAPPKPEELLFRRRKKICNKCESRLGCGYWKQSACKRIKLFKQPNQCCPKNHWLPEILKDDKADTK